MSDVDAGAAKMRQLVEGQHLVPNAAGLALAEVVVSLRPWRNERQVATALRAWGRAHLRTGLLEPGLADGPGQVAEHLHALGYEEPPLSDGDMLGITFGMLHNVALGRAPAEYDLLGDHVIGLPPRTMRRYRQRARMAGGNQGIDALHLALVAIQYDLDVAELVRRGRTPSAARRWLQRHPGLHANYAPAPRTMGTTRRSRRATRI